MREEFKVGERTRGESPNGEIPTKLCLSDALRFFAGASIYDIMLTHGTGKQSVYNSVYGVVDVVNKDSSLEFNVNGADFPSHDEQSGGTCGRLLFLIHRGPLFQGSIDTLVLGVG